MVIECLPAGLEEILEFCIEGEHICQPGYLTISVLHTVWLDPFIFPLART